jgi:cytoskeletal protein RodZ
MATVLQHPFGTTAFGDFLRTARERRGLTIQQIANETKIPRRLLESLEHGDLGAVPAGMYQRAEIRAYAKAVGLDPTLALSELERALGITAVPRDRRLGEGDADAIQRRPFLAAALVLAIALIGIVAWYGRMTPVPAEVTPAVQTRSQATATPRPASPVVAESAKAPADSVALPVAPQPLAATSSDTPGAPPAAGLITELVVVTEPAGARVIVDGIGRGTTPVTIRYLSAGVKQVRVLKEGFPAAERTVRLAPARQATTVVIPLQGVGQ